MTACTRLALLVERDHLLRAVATLPYGWTWARACAALAACEARLAAGKEAA